MQNSKGKQKEKEIADLELYIKILTEKYKRSVLFV